MEQPLACTLMPGQYADRTGELAALAARALRSREQTADGERLVLPSRSWRRSAGERDRVPVRIRDLHMAHAVRVGLDRLLLDPLDVEALEQRVERRGRRPGRRR
jgi:hypothetical protein